MGVRTLDKTKFWERTGAALATRNPRAAALTGAVLLLGVLGVGRLSAMGVEQVTTALLSSEIVDRLLGLDQEAQGGWMSHLLGDPEGTRLFLRYADALAPATTSLTVSPKGQTRQFNALLTGARDSSVTMNTFNYDAAQKRIGVRCAALSEADGMAMCKSVEKSGIFPKVYSVVFSDASAGELKEFTLYCDL